MLFPTTILMNTECKHIADELFSTLNGEAWYGDSVQKILEGVTSEQLFRIRFPTPGKFALLKKALR